MGMQANYVCCRFVANYQVRGRVPVLAREERVNWPLVRLKNHKLENGFLPHVNVSGLGPGVPRQVARWWHTQVHSSR